MNEIQITGVLRENLENQRFDADRKEAVLSRIQRNKKRIQPRFGVLAIVAVLLIGTALAAGIQFSPRVSAISLAERALEEQYGLSRAMTSFFYRRITENENETCIQYEGADCYQYVLGTYTVLVKEGKTHVSWSRDGADTSGGFDADAWGKPQLEEMIRLGAEMLWDREEAVRKQRAPQMENPFQHISKKAKEKSEAAGESLERADEHENIPSPSFQSAAANSNSYLACKQRAKLTLAEAREIMWQALYGQCGLNKEDMEADYDSTIAMQEWHYTMYKETPVFRFTLCTKENPFYGDLKDIDLRYGDYTFFINAETGVVEYSDFQSAYSSVYLWE